MTMAKKTRGYTTTRDIYKAVKKYDHRDFDEFCTRIYMNGYKDGQMAPKAEPEASADVETVMKAIKDVKGVGPALAEKIKKAIMGTLEEGGEKKDV